MHEMAIRPTGDLLGHLYPGVGFLVLGVWWLARVVWAEDRGIYTTASGRALSITTLGRVEAGLKIVLPVFAVVGEARWYRWPMTEASLINVQHTASPESVNPR